MNGELVIREATVADIPVLMDIRLSVTENVLSDPARITYQMYEDHLGPIGRGWVCLAEGTIVGFSCAAREDASIWALFVRPGYEQRGAGKGLLVRAVDWLFGLGHEEVKLSTAAGTRADRFYRAQGWTRGEQTNAIEVEYRLRRTDF